MLTTHDSFVQTYGVYEIRAKVPAGQGLWARFLATSGERELAAGAGRDGDQWRQSEEFVTARASNSTGQQTLASTQHADSGCFGGIPHLYR